MVSVKIPLGRARRRWEDNIRMDLQAIARVRVDWTDLAQGRNNWNAVANTVMKLRVP
jgi:hypothetical protein